MPSAGNGVGERGPQSAAAGVTVSRCCCTEEEGEARGEEELLLLRVEMSILGQGAVAVAWTSEVSFFSFIEEVTAFSSPTL